MNINETKFNDIDGSHEIFFLEKKNALEEPEHLSKESENYSSPVSIKINSSSNGDQKLKRNNKLDRVVECNICNKLLTNRRNLNRHLRTIHSIQPKVRKLKVKCSFNDCSFLCATSNILRNHLELMHNFNIIQKDFHFKSRSDFEKWKEEEEIKTHVSYVTDTGVKYRNNKKIYYLRCHRSGCRRSEEEGIKQRIRSKPLRGYTQCGFTCPSSIQLMESQNGNIDVCYFPKHLGHRTDDESIKYMKLRRKEKEEVAAKLVQGESVNKIISDARKVTGQKLSRINFLQRRDVYNIKSKVNFLEKEADQDGLHINSWISQLNTEGLNSNPIALYKPINKYHNYMLVIIHHVQKIIHSLFFDGSMVYVKTKKGKANVDFNLIVIYIINENGDGYPLAFCLSSKSDYSSVLTFFKVILESYGLITPQIFISDNNNYYYVAWKNVMGECENRLVCNFDVYAHWDQKLLELNCPVEKHQNIKIKLKSLLDETNPDIFDSELVGLLNTWSEDNDLKLFVKFFYKNYCKRPFEWANSYRIHSIRKENINKYLKPLCEEVEKLYAEGREAMHKGLDSIFSFIRNRCYSSLVKHDKDIILEKIKEIEKSHTTSRDVADIVCNNKEWLIKDLEMEYRVCKEDNECRKECKLICFDCDICVHDYKCSCSDNMINFNICSHIHAVVASNMCKMSETLNQKKASLSPLKLSAVSLSKTLTDYLENSNLTELQYDRIVSGLDNFIKTHSLQMYSN